MIRLKRIDTSSAWIERLSLGFDTLRAAACSAEPIQADHDALDANALHEITVEGRCYMHNTSHFDTEAQHKMSVTPTDVLVAHGPADVNGLVTATRDIQLSSTEGQQSINTTLDIAGLEALLQALGATIPIPSYPTADVLNKPLDIGRVYLANILQNLLDCDASAAYNAIQQPAGPDDGDLDIVVPRLGKGSDSSVAFGIIERVCFPVH